MTKPADGSQPVLFGGSPLSEATGAIILLHGRGGSAQDILALGRSIAPKGWALIAPEAAGNTWYPLSFLAPREQNEPQLTSALSAVQTMLQMVSAAGIPEAKIAVAGFSQGACLATEFVGRHPRRYAALLAFTGGLVGPLNSPLTLSGDLMGTPALLSSGDPDPHVPWARVQQSAQLLQEIGANVTLRRYPGKPHTVSNEEMADARELLAAAV